MKLIRNSGLIAALAVLILPIAASADSIVSSGAGTLHGTWLFDFDLGTEVGCCSFVGADVWWEQVDGVHRYMVPFNSATITNIGVVDFNSITLGQLSGLSYSINPIVGHNDASNQLVPGDVFAVHTDGGNFAKVQVLNYGYNLDIQWVTFSSAVEPIPEPGTLFLLGFGLLGVAGYGRKKHRRNPLA